MRPPIKTFLFLCALAVPVAAHAGSVMHLNTNELLSRSDAILLGEVVNVDQGLDSTRSQIRVLQVLKGLEAPGNLVTVESLGGKVYIEESEPNFSTLQANLLYLQKTDRPGVYTCVNRADGQKLVSGRNIYPYHDNPAYSVPLKDYLKGLEETIKALAGAGQAKAAG